MKFVSFAKLKIHFIINFKFEDGHTSLWIQNLLMENLGLKTNILAILKKNEKEFLVFLNKIV